MDWDRKLPFLRKNRYCWVFASLSIEMGLLVGDRREFSKNSFARMLGVDVKILLQVTKGVPPMLRFIISFWSWARFCIF